MDYKISIPKPCHENWGSMTPYEKGRFCSLCQKTVVDFTGKPKPEIVDYLLANADKNVCGRFGNEQLDSKPLHVTIPKSVFFNQPNFYRMFLLALFISMGSTLFGCKNDTTIGDVTVEDTVIVDTVQTDEAAIEVPLDTTMRHATLGIVASPTPDTLDLPPKPANLKSPGPTTGRVELSPAPPAAPKCTTGDVMMIPEEDLGQYVGKVRIEPDKDGKLPKLLPPPPPVQEYQAPKIQAKENSQR